MDASRRGLGRERAAAGVLQAHRDVAVYLARYLTDVDHVDHDALVALPTSRSSRIVGVARFIRDPGRPDLAEFAVAVDDAWQGRGLATLLLRRLGDEAWGVGIRRLTAEALVENAAVIALVRAAGASTANRTAGWWLVMSTCGPQRSTRLQVHENGRPLHRTASPSAGAAAEGRVASRRGRRRSGVG